MSISISSGRSGGGFGDSFDWDPASSRPTTGVDGVGDGTGGFGGGGFGDQFSEDFDDDDDAFFSSATTGGGGAAAATASDPAVPPDDVRADGSGGGAAQSSFGMLDLAYADAASGGGGGRRPAQDAAAAAGDDLDLAGGEDADMSDDAELMDLDRRCLAPLRDPGSPHRVVARCCLALNQRFAYGGSADPDGSASAASPPSSSSSRASVRIESVSVIHARRHQRLVRRTLSSLEACLSSHASPPCRSLAARTLAAVARASYARLRFDAGLATTGGGGADEPQQRLEDECGGGTARTLVDAAIEADDDGTSSAALEALGRLVLDPAADDFGAEVRGIAECAPASTFVCENGLGTFEQSRVARELQSRTWDRVAFPRMRSVLHRMSLYAAPHHLARAVPAATAALVHALTRGHDTRPERRALSAGKASHGKRGWRESDAEGLAADYVEGVLLRRIGDDPGRGPRDRALRRAIAVACARMAAAAPHAPWRVPACRRAAVELTRQLREMGSDPAASSSATAPSSPNALPPTKPEVANDRDGLARGAPSPIYSALERASAPVESLAGAAAALAIVLRGIPLRERAPGLTALLRATLLYLPMGVPHPSGAASLDLPVVAAGGRGEGGEEARRCRLGRVGLLTEAALCVMLDGAASAGGEKDAREAIAGSRAVLMRRVLHSDQLAAAWDGPRNGKDAGFRPADELLWAFCSVATRIGNKRERSFARDSLAAAEWSSVALVLLEFFAGFVCDPGRRPGASPFADAGRAAYEGLFAAALRRCGAFPPSGLSVSERMLPPGASSDGPSAEGTLPVVGGPGTRLPHVASALSRVAAKILLLREKSMHVIARQRGASVESGSNFVPLAALLVDSWVGHCIMNHDAKHSNEAQLDMCLPLCQMCHSEVEMLIKKHETSSKEDSFAEVAQLCQVLIASLEHIACMSELITDDASSELREGTAPLKKRVGSLAINMLNVIIASAKEGVPTNREQDSMLHYQIALDANNAISRIAECIPKGPQSYPDDIVSAFKVSPLIANDYPKQSLTLPGPHKRMDHCAWFLYHHARLVLSSRTDAAAEAVAPASLFSGVHSSSKLIQPRHPLRLPRAFTHSTVEMYQKLRDLPLLIPAQPRRSNCEVVPLTGCSEPISVTLSHGIRRVRKSCLSEEAVLIVTMRLYNITPVPIRNGVRLDLRISQEVAPNRYDYDGSNCVATSVYKHEIKGGDYITWEVTLGSWTVGNLSLRASVTFRELEQETSTHKRVSGGGADDDYALRSEVIDGEDETMIDITLPCMPTTLYTSASLQPCPLVFFGCLGQCGSNLGCGDTPSFEFLWQSMELYERSLLFDIPDDQMGGDGSRILADIKKGYVILSSSALDGGDSSNSINYKIGSAFVAPDGNRIFCTHQFRRGDSHALHVRSDSPNLLESLVGTSASQTSFLKFIFGTEALLVDEKLALTPPLTDNKA